MAVAAGDLKERLGTEITFGNSSDTVVFGTNLDTADAANGIPVSKGRISADADLESLGDGNGIGWYQWRTTIIMGTSAVKGESISIYFALSNGTNKLNAPTGDDAVTTADTLIGAYFVGEGFLNEVATGPFTVFGRIYIPTTHISVIWWNGSSDITGTGAGDSDFGLRAITKFKADGT